MVAVRIAAVTTVKNEIDIVESFVRHTVAQCDRLIVLDNGSTDGTLVALKELQAEGLPLEIVEDPTIGKHQWLRMTRLMRRAAEQGAGWVVPLDADEFLPPGYAAALRALPQDRPRNVRWRTYVPTEEDDWGERNPLLRIRHRLPAEDGDWFKVVVPGSLAGDIRSVLEQGSHAVRIEGARVPAEELDGLRMAHLPIRSGGQALAKMIVGQLQYVATPGREPGWGFQYANAFEQLVRDPVGFYARASELARRYGQPTGQRDDGLVDDPHPYLGGRLRLTPEIDDLQRAAQAVFSYAEQLARRVCELERAQGERDPAPPGVSLA
jgi:glycosyltransferase involved in cell wall biosynthesis